MVDQTRRRYAQQLLKDELQTHAMRDEAQINRVALDIEEQLFQKHGQAAADNKNYNDQLHSLIFILKYQKLSRSLLTGQLTVQEFVNMANGTELQQQQRRTTRFNFTWLLKPKPIEQTVRQRCNHTGCHVSRDTIDIIGDTATQYRCDRCNATWIET